uniref:Uncharacterized protein n=1 Tax=Lepeophtheirus salmonis TaxID=72036 RepID=A0A0K2TTM4_LEPSM
MHDQVRIIFLRS